MLAGRRCSGVTCDTNLNLINSGRCGQVVTIQRWSITHVCLLHSIPTIVVTFATLWRNPSVKETIVCLPGRCEGSRTLAALVQVILFVGLEVCVECSASYKRSVKRKRNCSELFSTEFAFLTQGIVHKLHYREVYWVLMQNDKGRYPLKNVLNGS